MKVGRRLVTLKYTTNSILSNPAPRKCGAGSNCTKVGLSHHLGAAQLKTNNNNATLKRKIFDTELLCKKSGRNL
jgi:hypothetical protein